MTLFSTLTRSHRGPGRQAIAARRAAARASLDEFAEELAETGDLAIATRRVGISFSAAESRLRTIRKQLGWQAV